MDEYEKLLAGARRLKTIGGWQEAINILERIKVLFPERMNELQLEILEIKFGQGLHEDVFRDLLACIQSDDGRLAAWMLQSYYTPFEREAAALQEKNLQVLEQYPYYYGAAAPEAVKALFYDGAEKLIYYKKQTLIDGAVLASIELKHDEIVLVSNVIDIVSLAEEIHRTKYNGRLPNMEVPVYLYYDADVFYALIQCVELQDLLRDQRVVLLVGEEQLQRFFGEEQVAAPERLLGYNLEFLKSVLDVRFAEKRQKRLHDQEQVEIYYRHAKGEIDERIRKNQPRILFVTSYFTTALQYHTKNLKRAADKLNLETKLLMERGEIFRLYKRNIYATLNFFRPDVIVSIDHFRFKDEIYPKEAVYLCWVQDPLSHIMSKDTPAKLTDRDFVLNHFTTWKEFREVGYPKRCLIDAPVPANQEIYRPYELTLQEQAAYSCDICFVCHASDVDAHIIEFVKKMPQELQEMVALIYKGYQQYVYTTGQFFYSKELFAAYIEGSAIQRFGWNITESGVDYLADDMYKWFNQRVFRQTLVDWLLDAGFTNIKLWGNGWLDNPKYKNYAMGPAENGETLSKIYQASKIVLGNNIMTTAAARAWETMLSGGFYMSNYIPPEDDVTDIRRIINVGEDVVMFYDKEDLLQKLHFYLEHEDERQRMIEKGRKAALEKMTFDRLLERTLNEVAERLTDEKEN